MTPIRIVIIDDEPLARDLLRSYIALQSDLELIGEAATGHDGLDLVEKYKPDLLLLDIQMPELSGLTLARTLKYEPAIIFITAFDSHALSAFELGAFDYLLKPVLPERFTGAVDRVRERRKINHITPEEFGPALRLDNLLHTGFLKHFFVREFSRLIPVDVNDIVRLEADDDYTAVFVSGRRLLVHVALRDMAARLDPSVFLRVHRSVVVNLAHVRSGGTDRRRLILRMSDGSRVTASRTGTRSLKALCP